MKTEPHIRFKNVPQVMNVGKIICLGRNYSQHAREMNAEIPKEPVLFLKPPTAIVQDGGSVVFPSFSTSLHHEVEMVIAIRTPGRNIQAPMASEHIAGYGVGLDMTLRDLQSRAKKEGKTTEPIAMIDANA